MGLLSARGLRNIAIGAGTGMLNVIKEAKVTGEQGLEELKRAREEVNEIATQKQQQYNQALKVGDRIGGGAFSNYVFNSMSMENIANLDNLQPTAFNTQMAELKKGFDSLPDAEKAQYEKGSYAEEVKASYNADIDRAKKEKGLTEINNVPSATAKLSLSDYLTRGVSEDVLKRSQEEVGKFEAPALAESKPVPMEFKSPEDIGITLNKKIKNLDTYSSMFQPVLDEATGEETGQVAVNPMYEGIVSSINKGADTMIENGFVGTKTDAIALYMESMNDPNFKNPALNFINNATEASPVVTEARQDYDLAKQVGNTELMLAAIESLENRNVNTIMQELQKDYDAYVKQKINEEPVTPEETSDFSTVKGRIKGQ